jgi:hypothetical protein
VRRAALALATTVLLLGPTVLAFFAGGYFDGPRAIAVGVAWGVVFILALVGPLPLPASTPGRLALGGLVGLAGWSAISLAWAPLAEPAVDNVQRLLLYVGALLASVALLRGPRAARAVEPVLALGALTAIGYGLAGRLLPDLVELSRSSRAGGRLEQPITYWNAEGLLAAIGLVLCIRLAGDSSRATPVRAFAAAAVAPLGLGVYLSYSRGAAVVALIGLIILLAGAPSRPQLRATIAGLVVTVVLSATSALFPGVASLEGSSAQQQSDGAIMLAVVLAAMVASAWIAVLWARAEGRNRERLKNLSYARRLPLVAAVAGGVCVAGLIVGGLGERGGQSAQAEEGPSRFASVESSRYEYWRVGFEAFTDDPIKGVGAGGYGVVWRMKRQIGEGVKEVHSLVLETATELGVPGLLLLALFFGGVAASGLRALRGGVPIAAAACAVSGMWVIHAAIDWDWQLPAVTLPAVVLAGALLAASEVVPSRSDEGASLPVASSAAADDTQWGADGRRADITAV